MLHYIQYKAHVSFQCHLDKATRPYMYKQKCKQDYRTMKEAHYIKTQNKTIFLTLINIYTNLNNNIYFNGANIIDI